VPGLQNGLNRVWARWPADAISIVTQFGSCGTPVSIVSEASQEKFPPSFWLLGSHYSGIASTSLTST